MDWLILVLYEVQLFNVSLVCRLLRVCEVRSFSLLVTFKYIITEFKSQVGKEFRLSLALDGNGNLPHLNQRITQASKAMDVLGILIKTKMEVCFNAGYGLPIALQLKFLEMIQNLPCQQNIKHNVRSFIVFGGSLSNIVFHVSTKS